MASVPGRILKIGSVQRRTALQLLLCYLPILFVAVVGSSRTTLVFMCLLSFLLMLNIPYNLNLLEIALERLSRGLSVEPTSSRMHWPLTQLFVLVNLLGQQTGRQVQLAQRNVEYRDQLVQQVGKTAAQEERNRLARDLHDSIKQQIFGIVVSAAAVKARWEQNAASARKIVDDIERTAQEAQVEMQALLQQLRPVALENVGLIESLRMQCQALGYRTGAEVAAELSALPPDEQLPLGAQEMIFRIVQEGFANIARHARASHAWLSLRQQQDTLLVEIGDDGQGFDLAQASEGPHSYGGMGLSNVRERASLLGGNLAIWSMAGEGTTLHLSIPLVKPQEQEQESLNQELTVAVRKTRRVLRIGMRVAELVAVSLLLNIPAMAGWLLATICMIVACVCWLWAKQYTAQIVMNFGRKHAQHFALRAESYSLLTGILLLAMLYPFYPVDHSDFGMTDALLNRQWLAVAFAILCLCAMAVSYGRAWQSAEQHYRTLTRETLQKQIPRLLQQVVIDWLVWTIVFGLTFLQMDVFPAVIVDSLLNPTLQKMGFVVLLAWFIVISAKVIRIARCYSLLRALEEQTSQKRGA